MKTPESSLPGPAPSNGSASTAVSEKPLSCFPAGLVADQQNEGLLLRAFLAHISDYVYFKDLKSHIVAASLTMAERHQTTPPELLGKTDFDFYSDGHAQAAYDEEQKIIRTNQGLQNKLQQETLPDGSVTWALTSKLPLVDGSGAVVGTFGISKNVTESIKMEKALETSQQQLMDAARQAGMAEVATGVLHNVGNVLTSINVTTSLLSDRFRDSKVTSIFKVCALFRENAGNLPAFFTNDPRAAKLPGYLESLATTLEKERNETMSELATLLKSIDHVKDIIWMQQSYAAVSGIVEPLEPADTIEDAIKLSNNALLRHNVHVERQFAQTRPARAERHKVLQILVNLISNAKKAMDCKEPSQRHLVARVESTSRETIQIKIIDNGVGIPPENLTKIFSHGFTTRKDGHGFGLHSSALAAKQMGGTLMAYSEGGGRGATFTLELPIWKEASNDPAFIKPAEECFSPSKAARDS